MRTVHPALYHRNVSFLAEQNPGCTVQSGFCGFMESSANDMESEGEEDGTDNRHILTNRRGVL